MNREEIHWSVMFQGRCPKRTAHHLLGDPQLPPDKVLIAQCTHRAVHRVAASRDLREEVTAIQDTVQELPDHLRDGAFKRFAEVAKGAKEALPDGMENRHITWFDPVLGRPFAADMTIEDDGKVLTVYEISKDGEVSQAQRQRMLFKGFVLRLHLNQTGAKTTGVRLMIMRPADHNSTIPSGKVVWDLWYNYSEAECAAVLAECRAHVQGIQAKIDRRQVKARTGGHCNRCPFVLGCKAGKRFIYGSEDAVPYSFASVLDLEAVEAVGSA